MRKRILTDKEFAEVRKLRQSGASWLQIEREKGIPRRVAQRAYEEWEQAQSANDLREARREVAAEAFRNHVDSILNMAEHLASNMDVPATPSENRDAERVTQDLLQSGIYQGNHSNDLISSEYRRRQTSRANELLLKALRDHTQGSRIWKIWQHWKDDWNSCISLSSNLESRAKTIVQNNLNQERGLLDNLRKAQRKYDPIERISEAITWTLWKQAIDEEQNVPKKIVSVINRNNRYYVALINPIFPSKFSNGFICSFTDQLLAEKVAEVCNRSYHAFIEGKEHEMVTVPLRNKILQTKKSVNDFARNAHSLLLRPMVIKTTCELCPA